MPTGYTAFIDKGARFAEYVWRCVHAFGTFANELPVDVKPEPYYKEELDKRKKNLADARKITLVEADRRAETEYRRDCARKDKEIKEWETLVARYKEVLAEAEAWDPPTPEHRGLKKFMIEQIYTGMPTNPNKYGMPVKMKGGEWLVNLIHKAQDDVVYYTEKWAEEQARCAQQNKWIKDLARSVPPPKKMSRNKKTRGA